MGTFGLKGFFLGCYWELTVALNSQPSVPQALTGLEGMLRRTSQMMEEEMAARAILLLAQQKKVCISRYIHTYSLPQLMNIQPEVPQGSGLRRCWALTFSVVVLIVCNSGNEIYDFSTQASIYGCMHPLAAGWLGFSIPDLDLCVIVRSGVLAIYKWRKFQCWGGLLIKALEVSGLPI